MTARQAGLHWHSHLIMKPLPYLLFFALSGVFSSMFAQAAGLQAGLLGAWRSAGQPEQVLVVTPDYWSQTWFDRGQRVFERTRGGSYAVTGNSIETRLQFDSKSPSEVGKTATVQGVLDGDRLTLIDTDGGRQLWTRIDRGESPLAGTWRITGRHVNGTFSEMPLRARRTLKILSGTRFQWVAINVETGDFSGTGGGTFTFKNGKYVEHIEFFSRDGSRVGASLEFNGEVTGYNWRHHGLSSKGEPLDETWSRFKGATP